MIEFVVRESTFTEVEDADIVFEVAGEGLDETAFAAAGWAVQEVAPAVRNSYNGVSVLSFRNTSRPFLIHSGYP